MGQVRKLRRVAAITTGLLALGAAPAAAEEFTTKALTVDTMVGPGNDKPCVVDADLYTPAGASKDDRRPALLTTNGFGGSKASQAEFAKAYAARGYVVLAYSGLGFGNSGCKITLDDRDFDGKAGRELVTFLGGGREAKDAAGAAFTIDYVKRDSFGSDGKPSGANDPRVGMFGGSYGGQNQFAVAGIDPRVDTIVPSITWNDLSYSLAPNNTSFARGVSYFTPGIEKVDWVTLFFAVGITGTSEPGTCPNFDDRACAAKAQMDVEGSPNAATIALARHASVADFMDDIRIPTLLAQGQADTLFNLQESIATFRALRARGVAAKMIWQSHGHSDSSPEPGELRLDDDQNYQGRTFRAWFDHYLKDAPAKPSLDITYFRDWVPYEKADPDKADATPAFARSEGYPAAPSKKLFLSGTDALVSDPGAVTAGSSPFLAKTGPPTNYTETSAVEPGLPVFDSPGTFAQYRTPPLTEDTDVVGVPTAEFRISAPASAQAGSLSDGQLLAVFVKLYEIEPPPSNKVILKRRLIAPTRIANLTVPVKVELPGIVHRFKKGSQMALTIATDDTAYRTNNAPGTVTISTDPARPGVLTLPVASAADQRAVVEAAPGNGTSEPGTGGEPGTGPTGPPGGSGPAGPAGSDGAAGSDGVGGSQGAAGSQAAAGPRGPAGAPGAAGANAPASKPAAKGTCGSRRAFRVTVKRQFKSRVRSGRVLVDGKRVASLGRTRTSALINLRGIKKSTVKVQLVMRLASGRRVVDVRTYRPCTRR